LPTVTVTVAALAGLGQKTRKGATIPIITAMRSEEAFMTSKYIRTIANNLLLPARQQR
jgi:hypothetical protein